MMGWLRYCFFILIFPGVLFAEQFTLFDETFTITAENAIQTQSHVYVKLPEKTAHWPSDWTQPVDYRNGSVHVRVEVLEKPAGGEPTHWSVCYIGKKSAIYGKPGYGCFSTSNYTSTGVFESSFSMTQFWNNQYVDWAKGVKEVHLVIKAKPKPGENGMSHAHKKELSKFFPTKVRVRLVQVSSGSRYDPKLVDKAEKPTAETKRPYVSPIPTTRKFRPISPK